MPIQMRRSKLSLEINHAVLWHQCVDMGTCLSLLQYASGRLNIVIRYIEIDYKMIIHLYCISQLKEQARLDR
jgi:hypothetical protein